MDAVAPTVGVAVGRADADGGLATVPVWALQATTDIASAASSEPNTRIERRAARHPIRWTLAGDTHAARRWPQAERMPQLRAQCGRIRQSHVVDQ
jgi:hypothetical protein